MNCETKTSGTGAYLKKRLIFMLILSLKRETPQKVLQKLYYIAFTSFHIYCQSVFLLILKFFN